MSKWDVSHYQIESGIENLIYQSMHDSIIQSATDKVDDSVTQAIMGGVELVIWVRIRNELIHRMIVPSLKWR